ncbi:ADAM 17-like protease [Physella acuta]|uniref:ADAM 17-like protease n=1 Tax=Physella acuta TaxID=109671 RepID=UPI0027DB2D29|nr:ADAM 17-like protease [Physella acuta]
MSDRFRKSGMRFCLHALLTYHAFPNRILGLAWTGAMCSDVSNRVEETTSLTTGLDEKHGPVHNLKVNLVLAHGHNFGSSHDPATAECSRPSNQGGNFLMWAKSVSGEHPNNKLFSPCSRVAIGRQLMMATCLTSNDVNHGFCGNSIQDHGEECDAGADGALDLDECCSATCMLRDGAICSDAMSPCCKNCKMAEKDIVCSDEGDYSCIQKSFCNGMSLDCPEAAKGKDFTSCFEGGTCYNGSCVGFCELESINSNFSVVLKPCLCAVHDKTACTSCCFDATDPDKPGPCLSRSEEVHKDGHPCYYGFCENGECKSHVTSTVKRFYSYLTSIPTDKLDRFIKSNLVMAIILITLMLWIPFSCFVFLNDLRQRARRERLFMIFFAGSGETKKELKKKESSFLQLLYLKGQRPSADQSGTSEQEIT